MVRVFSRGWRADPQAARGNGYPRSSPSGGGSPLALPALDACGSRGSRPPSRGAASPSSAANSPRGERTERTERSERPGPWLLLQSPYTPANGSGSSNSTAERARAGCTGGMLGPSKEAAREALQVRRQLAGRQQLAGRASPGGRPAAVLAAVLQGDTVRGAPRGYWFCSE